MAKTGERKAQILQTLASMLEEPKAERVTTALLAARLDVSEAALYRHFASKAQMFEGLIEFIEQSLFSLVNRIQADEADAMKQVEAILLALLAFAQKNPGMTRVLTGDALVNEVRTFDASFAHQQQFGTYHYHVEPIALRYELGDQVDSHAFHHGRGCTHCANTGYQGRTGVYEFLEMSDRVVEAINHEDPGEFMRVARQQMAGETLRRDA